MKIIVLHGDDERRLYLRLQKFIETARSRSWEVSYLDDETAGLIGQLRSSSLFGDVRFLILKDVKRLGKKETEWLSQKSAEVPGTLIIYHEGTLREGLLSSLPKERKVEEFKLPKLVWAFLDHIYPGNSGVVVTEFHKLIEKEPPEFIFSLMARLFRDLHWAKTDTSTMPMPSWRIGKLKDQSTKFSINLLILLIGELAKIDILVKTSKADLVSSLDLMIIKYLQ